MEARTWLRERASDSGVDALPMETPALSSCIDIKIQSVLAGCDRIRLQRTLRSSSPRARRVAPGEAVREADVVNKFCGVTRFICHIIVMIFWQHVSTEKKRLFEKAFDRSMNY